MIRSGITFVAVLLSFLAAPLAVVQAQPSLIVLVRHSEKADVPGNDPPLSEAGKARAVALASALANANVDHIIVTPYKRTSETAAQVAKARELTPQVISLQGGLAAHVEAVAAAVRAKKGTVLVVGHSNTIPAIVAALGGPKFPDICESAYATMYLLRPEAGKDPTLAVSFFGSPDAEGATSCPGMQAR